jgi:inositol-pentakisphosphate 2-kinase
MLPSASATLVEDWSYVAEGGATLVLRYMGAPHADFDGAVLRVRKRPRGAEPDDVISTSEEGLSELLVGFQEDVVAPLLPPDTVPVLRLVEVDPTWLHALASAVDHARPPTRRETDEVDTTRTTAILAPDLIGTSGVVVEIKVHALLLGSMHALTLIVAQMGLSTFSRSTIACNTSCEDANVPLLHACILPAVRGRRCRRHRVLPA